jgi:hypothetical protein
MSTEVRFAGTYSGKPSEAITAYNFVKIDAAATEILPSVSVCDAGATPMGVAQEDGTTTGGPISIAAPGSRCLLRVDGDGTAIAGGDFLKAANGGDGVKAATDGDFVGAVALQACTTANTFIWVQVVSPFRLSVPA